MRCKKLFNILVAVILAGCSTPPVVQVQSIEDKFADIIKANIKSNALKNSADCTIYSLNILHIDTLTNSILDSQLIRKASGRLEICNVMADLYTSMAQTNKRINALNKKKKGYFSGIDADDAENDTSRAQLYKDSAIYYSNLLDSLNKISARRNRFSDTVYQIRSFIKATERKNNDSTHYLGLKYYYISKTNKVLELSAADAGSMHSSPE